MAILTESPSSQWTSLGPPEEITGALVGQGLRSLHLPESAANQRLCAGLDGHVEKAESPAARAKRAPNSSS